MARKLTIAEAKEIVPESEIMGKLPLFPLKKGGGKLTEEELDNLIEHVWISVAEEKSHRIDSKNFLKSILEKGRMSSAEKLGKS